MRLAPLTPTALLLCLSCLALSAAPKAPIEQALVDQGRLYEAAALLERKAAKDPDAQRRAAELYLKLALYDRAAERFEAGGMAEAEAGAAVLDSALAQDHRLVALRYAKALGREAEVSARFAELELGAGRGLAALEWARRSGDAALVARAGEAAFDWIVAAPTRPRLGRDEEGYAVEYSPDGRFWVGRLKYPDRLEVADLRAPRGSDGKPPFRVVDAATELTRDQGYKDSLRRLKGYAIDPEGCILALYLHAPDPASSSQAKPKTYSSKGAHVYQLRLERLDTGLEIRTVTPGKDLADPAEKYFSKDRPICFAGGNICVALDKAIAIVDPYAGKILAKVAVDSAWTDNFAWIAELDGGKGIVVGQSSSKLLFLDAKTLAATGQKNDQKGYERYHPYTRPRSRIPAGYGSSAKIDYKAAFGLAQEFGLQDRFAALAPPLLAAGDLEQARFVMEASGKAESEIARAYADWYASRKLDEQAMEWYAKAGDAAKVASLTESRIASIERSKLDKFYADALARYATAGADPKPLRLAAARRYEEDGKYETAADRYLEAGALGDAGRLAFLPAAIDRYLAAHRAEKAEKWCMPLAEKAGMDKAAASARMAERYEARNDWADAVGWRLAAGDDKGARRIALARAAAGQVDEALELAGRIGKGLSAEIYRGAADARIAAGDYAGAMPWLEKLGDGAAVARIGDGAYKKGDLFGAAGLYAKARDMGWKADSPRAREAMRFAAVYDELRALRHQVRFGEDSLKRINSGEVKILWPVPEDKLSDQAYAQLSELGSKLSSLGSKPGSKEARACAEYMRKESAAELGRGYAAQANLDVEIANWMLFYAELLKAMGR